MVRMHRDTYLMGFDEVTKFLKGILEMGLPRIGTDGMGGKGDEIRGDSKKEEFVLDIIVKYVPKAGKVIFYGVLKTLRSV